MFELLGDTRRVGAIRVHRGAQLFQLAFGRRLRLGFLLPRRFRLPAGGNGRRLRLLRRRAFRASRFGSLFVCLTLRPQAVGLRSQFLQRRREPLLLVGFFVELFAHSAELFARRFHFLARGVDFRLGVRLRALRHRLRLRGGSRRQPFDEVRDLLVLIGFGPRREGLLERVRGVLERVAERLKIGRRLF